MKAVAAAILALLAAPAGAARPAARPPLAAHLNVFQPACSHVSREEVEDALAGASRQLQARCGIRVDLAAWYGLPGSGPWCALPADPAERRRRLHALARQAKAADPGGLALFLLPTKADERLSWALTDHSAESACDSPQERRFLDRFGSLFFTDLSFGLGPGPQGTRLPDLLMLHELLHSLSQRGHPSGVARGNVMADHVADMGPAVGDDWCACARQSPYLRPLKP